MKLDDTTFAKWQKWAATIKEDVRHLSLNQQMYLTFDETVRQNLKHITEHQGLPFCCFVRRCYAVYAASAVRRHLKVKNDSISLMRLLDQIRKCADQFTFDFFHQQFPTGDRGIQKGTFRDFSKDGKTVSKEIVATDMKTLSALTKNLEAYVDQTLAHLDKRGFDGSATHTELREAVGLLIQLTNKYLSLTGEGILSLESTPQFDLKGIFAVPLDPEHKAYLDSLATEE